MSLLWIVLILVAGQRLAELAYARRNTRRLLAEGAYESGAGHYPLLVGLHVLWLAAMVLLIPADQPPHWGLLGLFVLLQGLRLWILASLGRYWTTRVITLPGAPLVRRGPYRFLKHPNYLVVAAEIAVLPLAFGAWQIALIFSLANAAVLALRIRCEENALKSRPAAFTPLRNAEDAPPSSPPASSYAKARLSSRDLIPGPIALSLREVVGDVDVVPAAEEAENVTGRRSGRTPVDPGIKSRDDNDV